VHVAQVVFTLDVVLVVLYELIFVRKFEHDGEKAEKLDYDFRMALSAEVFDLLDVVLKDRRLGALMVPIELGEVVYLDVVHNRLSQPDQLVSLGTKCIGV
jgi:hypothetical protein